MLWNKLSPDGWMVLPTWECDQCDNWWWREHNCWIEGEYGTRNNKKEMWRPSRSITGSVIAWDRIRLLDDLCAFWSVCIRVRVALWPTVSRRWHRWVAWGGKCELSWFELCVSVFLFDVRWDEGSCSTPPSPSSEGTNTRGRERERESERASERVKERRHWSS